MIIAKDKTVVVVDDARINISKAEYILKAQGYDVIGFENGDKFLYALSHGDITADLLLLDIEMPEKDGIEVLKELREMPVWGTLPVIFVTGHVSAELITEAAKLKVAGYIKKPFVGEELTERVNMLLDED